jgi:hypothetical protein
VSCQANDGKLILSGRGTVHLFSRMHRVYACMNSPHEFLEKARGAGAVGIVVRCLRALACVQPEQVMEPKIPTVIGF